MKSVASLLFLITIILLPPLARAGVVAFGGGSPTTAQPDPVLVEKWALFNGKIISAVIFNGLKRTKEKSVRWLMKSLEGQSFSSYQLAVDVQTLSNTGNVYNVTSEVVSDPQAPDHVQIIISLSDKWTLLPVGGGQGGGGVVSYGGGLKESNLFGTFTELEGFLYNYNGMLSYDVYTQNEFIAGSQTMVSFDWNNTVYPTVIHNVDDSTAGNYIWQRQQEELMVGTHLPGPLRLQIFGDYYFDSINNITGVDAAVYQGIQYRLHPVIIVDRVNIIEFLEEGTEVTIQPMAANFFGPVEAYQGIDVQYKRVFRVGAHDNLAFNAFAGGMSLAPPPYEYEVGGYQNIRGYSDSREIGPYTAVGTIEYRPLLFKHQFGTLLNWDVLDVDLVALQGCIFSDFGSAWGDSTLTGDPGSKQLNVLWSAGAGIRLHFLHYAGAILRLDLARTIRPDEGWGLSFGIGQFF